MVGITRSKVIILFIFYYSSIYIFIYIQSSFFTIQVYIYLYTYSIQLYTQLVQTEKKFVIEISPNSPTVDPTNSRNLFIRFYQSFRKGWCFIKLLNHQEPLQNDGSLNQLNSVSENGVCPSDNNVVWKKDEILKQTQLTR